MLAVPQGYLVPAPARPGIDHIGAGPPPRHGNRGLAQHADTVHAPPPSPNGHEIGIMNPAGNIDGSGDDGDRSNGRNCRGDNRCGDRSAGRRRDPRHQPGHGGDDRPYDIGGRHDTRPDAGTVDPNAVRIPEYGVAVVGRIPPAGDVIGTINVKLHPRIGGLRDQDRIRGIHPHGRAASPLHRKDHQESQHQQGRHLNCKTLALHLSLAPSF